MHFVYFGFKVFFSLSVSFLMVSCSSIEEKYGVTEMYHGRPKPVAKVPRTVFGSMPSGPFETQEPHSIIVMDSGADYQNETSFTYLQYLLERYVDSQGKGDFPVHFFVDKNGQIFTGRQPMTPARIYKNDSFTIRSDDVDRKEALWARLKRHNGEPLDLKNYIVVMVLGDYDNNLVDVEQEQKFFQLLSNLVYDYKIPREQIYGLNKIYPNIKNPGYYLNNYLQSTILEKNIPPPPVQHRFMIPPTIHSEEQE